MSRRIHIEVADRLTHYAFISKETPSRPYHLHSIPPLIDLRKHTQKKELPSLPISNKSSSIVRPE
jgi:hypothetical protein